VELVEGYPIPFALNYTFGHILQLLASTFLCGPKRQFKYVSSSVPLLWRYLGFLLVCSRSMSRALPRCS
jgi:hypothetical protein